MIYSILTDLAALILRGHQAMTDVRETLVQSIRVMLDFLSIENLAPLFFNIFSEIVQVLAGLGGEGVQAYVDESFEVYLEPFFANGMCIGAYYFDWFIPWEYFSAVFLFIVVLVPAALSVRAGFWFFKQVRG